MDSARASITASEPSLTFCDGDSILLTANSGMANYLWMPPVQSGIQYYASHGGPYVLITTSTQGCTATDSIQITMTPNSLTPPVVNDTVLCAGLSTALFASGMDTLYWSHSPLFDTIIQTGPSHHTRQLFATTNYFVRSQSGICKSASDTLTVFIDEHCNEILIPNIITPNNDGKNDFFPVIDGYYTLDIKIYDRWGRLTYESTASTVSWNGKNMAGNECPDGTYYYILEVHFFDQTIERQHGALMLIR
jgi:gliding motility-associated-like protein